MSIQGPKPTSSSVLPNLFRVCYPLSVYQKSDNWCEECFHQVSRGVHQDVVFSVVTTNVIIEILTTEIIQHVQQIQDFHSRINVFAKPIDSDLVDRVFEIVSKVLSFIPETQTDHSDLPLFRGELRKRTLNVFYALFSPICNDFVEFFIKTQESKQAGESNAMPYMLRICDGVACECFRRLDVVQISFDAPVVAKIYLLLEKIEKAKKEAAGT